MQRCSRCKKEFIQETNVKIYKTCRPCRDYDSARSKHIQRRIYTYKKDARKRGYEWNLQDSEALDLFSGKCHYCGSSGNNGIDRVLNSMGYRPDNCVSCCARCNYMKSDLTLQEFLEHISKIQLFHSIGHG